eukprot:878518-Prorocentrum_minimum.AAC.7
MVGVTTTGCSGVAPEEKCNCRLTASGSCEVLKIPDLGGICVGLYTTHMLTRCWTHLQANDFLTNFRAPAVGVERVDPKSTVNTFAFKESLSRGERVRAAPDGDASFEGLRLWERGPPVYKALLS